MPFARVGAMPQPAPSKNKNEKRKASSFQSSSKPKGITIEDLKKQTAIRLAQEQQQKRGDGYFVDQTVPTSRQPLVDQQVPVIGHQFQQSTGFLVQHVHSAYPVAPASGPAMVIYPNSTQHLVQQAHIHHNPQIVHQRLAYNRLNDEYIENMPIVTQNFHQHAPAGGQEPEASQRHSAVGQHDLMVQGKPKLPHGLTVHELKEMTRARLQAEGPEPGADMARDASLENRGISPLDFDSLPETRDRTSSRDSGYANNFMNQGPGTTNSIPSMVQVNQHFRDPEYTRQPQISPVPPGLQSTVGASGSAFTRPKADTWDNLSVASAFSENLGSESVYSVGVSSAYSQPNDSDPFKQGSTLRGHPPGLLYEDRNYPASAHSSPSNGNRPFDATIGGNRRRSMTHSPRASAIQEDRPIMHTGQMGIPSFSASTHGALQSRVSSNYSPVLMRYGDMSQEHGAGYTRLGESDPIRHRTDSAISLPARPQGMPGPDRDRAHTMDSFPQSLHLRRDGWNNDISGALTESFLRAPHPDTAPPGFGSSTRNAILSSASPINDPWSTGFPSGGTSSIFNNSTFDDLANDMGSVLKLSGGTERPDRERSNTYPYGNFR